MQDALVSCRLLKLKFERHHFLLLTPETALVPEEQRQ
jgi:hypothetical protein